MGSKVDLRRPGTHRGDDVGRELVAELVRRRRKAGLSQTELAEKIGTSQRTMSQLENLAHEPKLGTFLSWAQAVGLQLSWRVAQNSSSKLDGSASSRDDA